MIQQIFESPVGAAGNGQLEVEVSGDACQRSTVCFDRLQVVIVHGEAHARIVSSSQHSDRYVGPTGDVDHHHSLQAVAANFVPRHEVEQLLQGYPCLHTSQGSAQTAVHSVAKSEVLRLGAVAVDVEDVGIGERRRVAVGGRADEKDRLAGGIVTPCRFTSLSEQRTLYWTGPT